MISPVSALTTIGKAELWKIARNLASLARTALSARRIVLIAAVRLISCWSSVRSRSPSAYPAASAPS